MNSFRIRPLTKTDRGWAVRFIAQRWGASIIVTRSKIHHGDFLLGFVAWKDAKPVGLLTYNVEGDKCEIVSLDSVVEKIGIGSALIEAVKEIAVVAKCKRIWLVTTNDNMAALRFYQKRGFVLAALHRNALEQSRKLKPEIPLIGLDGIPLRDELELEMRLTKGSE